MNFEVRLDNINAAVSGIRNASLRALERIGEAAEGYAVDLCPVGTPESTGIPGYVGGTLKTNITHFVEKEEAAAYIGTNVEYGIYVEMGTKKMEAQPFLRPAATDHTQTYKNIFEDEMKNG